jgi:hypothetical protein
VPPITLIRNQTAGHVAIAEYVARNTTTTPASGNVVALEITVDTEAQDTGAGIRVHNHGHSDNIYLGVNGKPEGETAPTGIGMDVNRPDNPGFRGYGLQVWDWGRGVAAATAVYLRKHLDPNNLGRLLVLRANRGALSFEVPEGEGYDPAAGLIDVHAVETGAPKWYLTAGGAMGFGAEGAIFFPLPEGGALIRVLAGRLSIATYGGDAEINGVVFTADGRLRLPSGQELGWWLPKSGTLNRTPTMRRRGMTSGHRARSPRGRKPTGS